MTGVAVAGTPVSHVKPKSPFKNSSKTVRTPFKDASNIKCHTPTGTGSKTLKRHASNPQNSIKKNSIKKNSLKTGGGGFGSKTARFDSGTENRTPGANKFKRSTSTPHISGKAWGSKTTTSNSAAVKHTPKFVLREVVATKGPHSMSKKNKATTPGKDTPRSTTKRPTSSHKFDKFDKSGQANKKSSLKRHAMASPRTGMGGTAPKTTVQKQAEGIARNLQKLAGKDQGGCAKLAIIRGLEKLLAVPQQSLDGPTLRALQSLKNCLAQTDLLSQSKHGAKPKSTVTAEAEKKIQNENSKPEKPTQGVEPDVANTEESTHEVEPASFEEIKQGGLDFANEIGLNFEDLEPVLESKVAQNEITAQMALSFEDVEAGALGFEDMEAAETFFRDGEAKRKRKTSWLKQFENIKNTVDTVGEPDEQKSLLATPTQQEPQGFEAEEAAEVSEAEEAAEVSEAEEAAEVPEAPRSGGKKSPKQRRNNRRSSKRHQETPEAKQVTPKVSEVVEKELPKSPSSGKKNKTRRGRRTSRRPPAEVEPTEEAQEEEASKSPKQKPTRKTRGRKSPPAEAEPTEEAEEEVEEPSRQSPKEKPARKTRGRSSKAKIQAEPEEPQEEAAEEPNDEVEDQPAKKTRGGRGKQRNKPPSETEECASAAEEPDRRRSTRLRNAR